MSALMTLTDVAMRFSLASGAREQQHTVFEGLDFSLSAGECVGLIGRNGAGKSTLLRVMAKILAPSVGDVHWAPGVSASLLSLGLGFRPDLTGQENALLANLLQGMSKADARRALPDIEAFCELGDYFNQPVRTYSSGMRARLGFATALKNRSQVILIDEVLSVGDQAFRVKARQALKSQFSEDRATVIVSHAEQQLKILCSRAVWLDQSGILSEGDPEVVLDAYADRALRTPKTLEAT